MERIMEKKIRRGDTVPIFPTLSDTPRPIRLADATRQFAYESQMGKYGDDAMSTPYVDMTEFPGFFTMEPMDQYDAMLSEIVRKAPVRVTPYERIAGAATLGAAIWHVTPAYANGKFIAPSISHVTLGFDRAVREGMDSYEERIKARLQEPCDTYGRRFLLSLLHTIDSMRVWHARYMEALRERPEIRDILRNVPFCPASSFKEALLAEIFDIVDGEFVTSDQKLAVDRGNLTVSIDEVLS